jgi:hypothetical protein
MRDTVRHVPEQELPSGPHADVADHEEVRALLLGPFDDAARGVRMDLDLGAGPRRELLRQLRQRGLELRVRLRGDTEENELRLVPAGELGRPRDRSAGGLRAVGCDDDPRERRSRLGRRGHAPVIIGHG